LPFLLRQWTIWWNINWKPQGQYFLVWFRGL